MYQKAAWKAKPSSYSDPDASDAENLIRAAYYLDAAGRTDLSDGLIAGIVPLFDHKPVAKSGARELGDAKYYPSGILSVKDDRFTLEVSAPAYQADQDETRDAAAEKSRIKENLKIIERIADLNWFQTKQLSAAVLGTPLRPVTLPILRDLTNISRICSACKPDLEPEALQAMAGKIHQIIQKSPAGKRSGAAWYGLINRTWKTHQAIKLQPADEKAFGGETMTLHWLGEAALEELASMAASKASAPYQFYNQKLHEIPMRFATWEAVMRVYPEDSGVKRLSKHVPPSDQDPMYPYVERLEYAVLGAAVAVCNMLRIHDAMCSIDDEYLSLVLTEAGIMDPEREFDPDLPYAAGAIISYLAEEDMDYNLIRLRDSTAEDEYRRNVASARKTAQLLLQDLRKHNALAWQFVRPEPEKD